MEGDLTTAELCDQIGESAVCEYRRDTGDEEQPPECFWEYREEKINVPPEIIEDDLLTMSDMMLNDTIPFVKKMNQMFRYNLFNIKFLEFVVSAVLNCVPMFLSRHSIPRRTITWHDVPDYMYCLSAGPPLILSLIFMILYMADQIHDFAEQLYVFTALCVNLVALLMACNKTPKQSVNGFYAILHIHLTVVLLVDMWLLVEERGWTLFDKPKNLPEPTCVKEEIPLEDPMEHICDKHEGPPICEDNPFEDQIPA